MTQGNQLHTSLNKSLIGIRDTNVSDVKCPSKCLTFENGECEKEEQDLQNSNQEEMLTTRQNGHDKGSSKQTGWSELAPDTVSLRSA